MRSDEVAIVRGPAPVRAIAMYLPQFHRVPENDKWWGDGFTEWTNVRRSRPFYRGHVQPWVPHPDIGYYSLSDASVLERQAELARAYGVQGFCFYHYWFGGRRLLEMPLERMLLSGRPNFPFCVCWANEDWTRTWDGRGSEVLVGQRHSVEGDQRFMTDLLPYLRDSRYIRVEGKPLVAVFRPGLLVRPSQTVEGWRELCRRAGIGEIHLVSVRSFDKVDPTEIGFDATIQFPPLQIPAPNLADQRELGVLDDFKGIVLDYNYAAEFSLAERAEGYRMYRGVMPAWDNTPRRMERATSWVNASPDGYREWLARAVQQTMLEHQGDHRLVFINAWNEWAEGANLEPDAAQGYARLACTASALGRPVHGLDSPRWEESSLPSHTPALLQWMQRRVLAVCTELSELSRLDFLADYVCVLEQAKRRGCEIRCSGGRLLARLGDRSVEASTRAGMSRLHDLAVGGGADAPFCFVVLQHNKWEVTARCLESLLRLRSPRPVRIVVVDNGSDESVVKAAEAGIAAMANVELLKLSSNIGFSAGNNAGYRHARAKHGATFIAVINNDTRIEDELFTVRCEATYREWGCSVIGPDVVTPDGRRENPWNDSMYSTSEWEHVSRLYDEDHKHFVRTGEARWRRIGSRSPAREVVLNPILQGAALILTPVFTESETTLFDERTELYGEEFGLAVRNMIRGHLTLYTPAVRVLHEEGVTTGGLPSRQKQILGYVNGRKAAMTAGAELQSALLAAEGVPIRARDPALAELLAPDRNEVLVDLLFCQPGFHGGGEYGKAVFAGLVRELLGRGVARAWAALDPSQYIDPWILESCRQLGIRIIEVHSYSEITELVNSDRFSCFFCPAIVVYTGYEYMRKVGTELPFTCRRTRVVGTLHDLRDLQLMEQRDRIASALAHLGCSASQLARLPATFPAADSHAATALARMYEGICADKTVSTLITVSQYCGDSIAKRFHLAPRGMMVLASPERPRSAPQPSSIGVPGPECRFGLMLNAQRPEKNGISAVVAFDRMLSSADASPAWRDLYLVLVGLSSIEEVGAPALRNSERILCIPPVSPGELETLMSRAEFLLYPSFNEGFGYPPIEAMRYGTPSVVASCTAIPEVCGDAAVYCDPFDVKSIEQGIREVLRDPPSPQSLHQRYEYVRELQQRDLGRLIRLIVGD